MINLMDPFGPLNDYHVMMPLRHLPLQLDESVHIGHLANSRRTFVTARE
jgi:hypothetical protein